MIFDLKIGLIIKKVISICIFLQKNLHMSEKSSTFAPAFDKREHKTRFLSSVG